MWPLHPKKADNIAGSLISVAKALEQVASVGVHVRPGISHDDLLHSIGGSIESTVDWVRLLCVLGSEVERGNFDRVSDDIWHFDAECIEADGDYVAIANRFVILAKGALPLADIRDRVKVEDGEAWLEFALEGQRIHWDLKAKNDWADPELYLRLQQLVAARTAGKRFFTAGLGQDSLISFGDDQMRQALSKLSGLEFQWE
ncbi:conserved hypothetical protein [Verrucomicrobia bacterium]|nr:conserved hypothetical protein [Verrucomicrobiota bacterium]